MYSCMAQVPHQARAQVDQDDHDQDNGKVPQFLDKAHVQIPDEKQDQPRPLQVPFQDQDQARVPQDQDQDRLPNQDQNGMPKKSKGRQKIDIAKMQNESNLQVTFSKRRYGLFKKASEIVTLCGVELVIIVFSPGNKPFSFGHPSVDDILDRFLSRAAPPPDTANNIMLAQRNDNVRILNNQLTNMQAMFEAERQKKLALDQARTVNRTHRPWEAPIDELSRDELVALKAAMLNLQANLAKHIEMRMQQEQQNPSAFQPGASSYGGGSGGGIGGGRGAASSSYGGNGNDVFASFPPGPNSFGEGGGGFPQYVDGSTSYGGGVDPAFSTGLNYFGGGAGGALPFSNGRMISQSSMGSSSLGGGGALPFSTWSSSFGGGNSSFSGALPLFPGESSLFPQGMSSIGGGGSLPFPQGSSSFGRGNGHALQMGPSSSGLGGGGALHIGPSPSGRGRGRGRGRPPGSARGRGSNRGIGRESQ